jgi:hypothetical protein
MTTSKTEMAIARYGLNTCYEAYKMNEEGEGASTIGIYLGLTTRQADAAINAGRELTFLFHGSIELVEETK